MILLSNAKWTRLTSPTTFLRKLSSPMASAYDGGTADLARALTASRREFSSSSMDGHEDGGPDPSGTVPGASPPRSRHSSSSSEAARLRLRAKLRREAEFMSVRGTLTHVIKYGAFDDSIRTLAIVVPGNPGVPEYYEYFMETLHLASGRSLPVWCVSHAGHVQPDWDSEPIHLPPFQQSDPHRSLRGQVAHKLAFIKDHVMLPFRNLVSPALSVQRNVNESSSSMHLGDDKGAAPAPSAGSSPGGGAAVPDLNLILIGHSIGCWMICEMMKKMKPELKKRVLKAYLLFPTIGKSIDNCGEVMGEREGSCPSAMPMTVLPVAH